VKIVVDSYAWIEVFAGTRKGEKAKEVIGKADAVLTPDIVLAEIARKYIREGLTERTVKERLIMISEASQVIAIDASIAFEAARAYFELKERAKDKGLREPSLFDAIVLGSSRVLNANIITGDEHFKDMPETIWLETKLN